MSSAPASPSMEVVPLLGGEAAASRESLLAAAGAPTVAVIGAGYLGQRIVAELLLLGSRVSIYDQGLAARGAAEAQAELNGHVLNVLKECDNQDLLALAGLRSPEDTDCRPQTEDGQPLEALFCASVAEAVRDAEIVLEAVPDKLVIKQTVFAEALAAAPPGVLLATSTLSLPLEQLRRAVADMPVAAARGTPRVVGLRFLSPVVFVPFVEITLTAAQMTGPDRSDLLSILARWGKSAFDCDVQGAADNGGWEDTDWRATTERALQRFRLLPETAARRQAGEARLRRARRQGPAALAAMTSAQLFDFADDRCCICLEAAPIVTSVICGHCVLCAECAELTARANPKCPICRADFKAAVPIPR